MTTQDQATTTTTKPKKVSVADHFLLDATGAVVESEDSATGARYTLLANKQSVDYQHGKSADMDRMLAVFGFKTLATNETSQQRNNPKGAASPDEQIQAVRDRMDYMAQTGKWLDSTRTAGPVLDLDKLADAVKEQFESEGKSYDRDAGRAKLESDLAYRSKVRSHLGVAAKYAALMGKTAAATDDLSI
jgi:hypothetical protein